MKIESLTTRLDHAYKLRLQSGKWSPFLTFVKTKEGFFIFTPSEDTESTLEIHVMHLFVASEQDVLGGKHYVMDKKYGTWEHQKL